MQRPARILRFDQFLLDPGRQTILTGGQEIRLRPKAFDLLHYLAKHSGRLVTKQELHEAIWPTVVVSDDVLVQCIRELRRALADHKHHLIKTVSRRGYLLDSKPKARCKPPPADPREISPQIGMSPIAPPLSVPLEFTPATLPASAVSKLFKKSDAKRAAAIAERKQLPMPPIQIGTPDDDVPADIRRFIGIWVSEKGFVNTNRQFMFAVTRVEKAGLAGGYTVRGPPAPNSRLQIPAAAVPFTALISDGVLTYSNPRGHYRVWFSRGGGLVFKQTYVTGDITMVALEPIWTLVGAERAAARRPSRR
jgi:DNA-binding winged helix-turn-helix (wHTH) protein